MVSVITEVPPVKTQFKTRVLWLDKVYNLEHPQFTDIDLIGKNTHNPSFATRAVREQYYLTEVSILQTPSVYG